MFSRKYEGKHIVKFNYPFCTFCGANLTEQKGFSVSLKSWICIECKQPLFNNDNELEKKRFPDMLQLCDKCGAILDNQEGFTDWADEWKCTECGYVSPIGDEYNSESDARWKFEKEKKANQGMTIKEARIIEDEFYRKSRPTEEDIFMFTEAMEFLIDKEKNPRDMMSLGGHYYDWKNFDLALKYYDMAATYDYTDAYACLGYIWYYGRTGEKNYKLAFENYTKAAERGDLQCAYKLADMYKNGYYVEKDYEKYKEMVEEIYSKLPEPYGVSVGLPIPEVYTRLARIRVEQDRVDEAVDLYVNAKEFLAQRIKYNAFFGNLNIMSWLIKDLYELIEFDEDFVDLFDMYYLLRKPAKVSFKINKKKYEIESLMEDGECVIKFGENWYRTVDDFIQKASINNRAITALSDQFYSWEVLSWTK